MAQANPFDQFDVQAEASNKNPFDQFDFGSYPSVIAREGVKGLAQGIGGIVKGAAMTGLGSPQSMQTMGLVEDDAPPPPAHVQSNPIYKAGEAINQAADKYIPTTRAEDESFTGQASRIVGGAVPFVAGAMVAPEAAIPASAVAFGLSSAGQTFDEAKAKGASDDEATHAAGLSGLVGGGLGVLPLGAILTPVRRLAPGLAGWAATKLAQAVQSGAVFSSVGEAQTYLQDEIAKAYYDKSAQYSPDFKRMAASFVGGAGFGVVHPIAPPRQSTPEELAAFHDAEAQAPNPNAPQSATRTNIDEFIQRRDAGWTYDDATGQWTAPQAGAGQPRLPPPSEPGATAPAAEPAPPAAPAPGDVSPPAAGAGEFPSLDEPGRTAPVDNPFNRFDGADGQPVAAAGPPVPAAREEAPAPPANHGPATLEALFKDPRSAVEIRAQIDAIKKQERDSALAAAATGEAHAQPGPGQPAGVDLKVNNPVNTAPSTPQTPVRIEQPADVLAGAEHTATPTPAQAEAGNYRKRHIKWQGLDLAIETEAGQDRRGVDQAGNPWSVTLLHPYGYVKGTTGKDGDQVDVTLGPDPRSPTVYIVDQIDPGSGGFDEHKALIGFPDEASARQAYASSFSDGLGPHRIGALTALPLEQFKSWLSKGQRRAPIAYSDPVQAVRGLAREHGLNASDDDINAAVQDHRVNKADLTEALFNAVERSALVEEADSPDSIQRQEVSDGRPVERTGTGEAGAELAQAGKPAGRPGAQENEQAPARGEPDAAQSDRGAPPVAPAAEPEITAPALSTAKLTKLIPQIAKMAAAKRAETQRMIDEQLATMADEGKKIAEHCVETGAKFSIR